MKTKILVFIILLLGLTVLFTRSNKHFKNVLLDIVNPIKQNYKNFTQNIEDKSHSYIFQKESIEKLGKENRILRKRLFEQMHYVKQIKNVYDVLPQLQKMPVHNISIVETISYVKLNSFSQVILTKPKAVVEDKLYGLIQGTVVAGIAKVDNNQLYGYLTSNTICRFSVFIGQSQAPGIAIGVKNHEMRIKFIPKWHKIKIGDKVITSGLDNIFFANIPVGIVTKVEIQSAYTVAYIKTYSDIFHPKTFFLVNDAKATLIEDFDSNLTQIPLQYNISKNIEATNSKSIVADYNQTIPIISSIPTSIDQTQEEGIEPEVPAEEIMIPKKIIQKKLYKKKKLNQESSSLDLF